MLSGSEGPGGTASLVQGEGTSGIPGSIGGDEISDIKRLLFACCGVAISVGEASEQLLLGDGVVGVLSTTREIGDGIGINDGDVVGAGECDDERAAVGSAVVISNLIVDGDVLGVTSSEALVGGISWIERTRRRWR